MTVHVNVPLSDEQKAQLESVARHEKLSPERFIASLVQQRLDYESRFRGAVEVALGEVERGETLSHEEVAAMSQARRERLLRGE